jgi:tetratricopeptide (TPR) repeat protein
LTVIALLVAACSRPEAVPPSSPGPEPQEPPQLVQAMPAEKPTPAEEVHRLLSEIQELHRQQGTGIEIRTRIDQASSEAGHDAQLLTQIAWVVLDVNWGEGLQAAIAAAGADDAYMPAQVALGAALYTNRRYEDSLVHLEHAYEGTHHSLEAGYLLAQTLEALGQIDRAGTLLTDLTARFPDSIEAKQALARLGTWVGSWPMPGTPNTGVATWEKDRMWITSQLLIGIQSDGQTIEAVGLDGKSRWTVSCGGKARDLVLDETRHRAMVAATDQSCLIDLATGQVLFQHPGPAYSFSLEGLAWRGDLIAFAEDVQPAGKAPMGYFGTDWKVYQIHRDTSGKAKLDFMYTSLDGSRMAALSRDGKTLFSWFGNHGAGRPRLFQDGQKVTEYPQLAVGAEFALDPRDDRFYFVSYTGTIQARRLDGSILWEDMSAPGHAFLELWTDDKSQVRLTVTSPDGTVIYDADGKRLWSTPDWPVHSVGRTGVRYLLVSHDRETLLVDTTGQIAGRYPGATSTLDGKALIGPGVGLNIYRLP